MAPLLPSEKPPLCDAHGRQIRYLRVSVTDRCNLRCLYCWDGQDRFIPHASILRYEEIEALLQLLVTLGVRKVRFTGGEPFARKGFLPFLERVRARFPALALRLTTNGTLLDDTALRALRDLDIPVNLSLDSLRPERFARITGQDAYHAVRRALDGLLVLGVPLKINAVALRGFNDDELPGFLRLVMAYPLELRLIEFMPMGQGTVWSPATFWSAADMVRDAGQLYTLLPETRSAEAAGPARLWRLRGADGALSAGRFGVIASVTANGCGVCNRLRLTAEGNVRTCLFDDRDYPLRDTLRDTAAGPDALEAILRAAVARKPIGAELLAQRHGAVARRRMVAIGG